MSPKSFVVGLAALSVVSAAPVAQWDETNVPAIVGGVPAVAGDFPFIISLQKNGAHFCGGSLLDSTTVLTAAHCADGQTTSGLTVRAGSLNRNSGGVTSPVASLNIHPGYDADIVDKDVAILKLRTPIAESSTIKYATLAAAGSDPAANTVARTAGWGTTQNSSQSNVSLRKVDVPIVSRADCIADYQKDTPPKTVTTNMICAGLDAGGKDSCQGDSGGPIIDMEPGQHYKLQISGGNPTVHNAFLSLDANGSLIVSPLSPATQHAPAVVTAGDTPHTLTTLSSPQSSYILRGPAGKGIYQLRTSSSTKVRGFGSRILHDAWDVFTIVGRPFLRYKGLNSGFWIAVPDENEGETTWSVWWLQPGGATVEDFENYVIVDIELVKAKDGEKDI
ncbi:hypothetical protein E8E12_011711 [Didymella heteroderae]|uniref:Peptidase S1 domain-containing protein n=1 Tax=Didymella heteroderae TaxID=1769908 RepID=A0A9P4X0N7_9PLEO|nr:hypothetical protein E8E12_011711 [Didymella heteroderae]